MLHLSAKLLPLRSLLLILFIIGLLSGCNQQRPGTQQIINNALEAHGWENYRQGVISFRQEDKLYRVLRDGDATLYSRTFQTEEGRRVHDVLTNDQFTRTIDDQEVTAGPREEEKYSEELRSAIFFALLPYTLQDAGMQQDYIGNVRLNGEPYHKISVKLPGREGKNVAGTYLLWFHRQRHTLDFMVFTPTGQKTGSHFCQAVNQRKVGGILFQDYVHYTTLKRISPARYDYAYEGGKLVKTSETKLQEIIVTDLPSL